MKNKKYLIPKDERWIKYNELKKQGKIFDAIKLKNEILDSTRKYKKFIKQCHHISGICT